jgi:hypothetical protein
MSVLPPDVSPFLVRYAEHPLVFPLLKRDTLSTTCILWPESENAAGAAFEVADCDLSMNLVDEDPASYCSIRLHLPAGDSKEAICGLSGRLSPSSSPGFG